MSSERWPNGPRARASTSATTTADWELKVANADREDALSLLFDAAGSAPLFWERSTSPGWRADPPIRLP